MPYIRCYSCPTAVSVPTHKVKVAYCESCVQKVRDTRPEKKVGVTIPPAFPEEGIYKDHANKNGDVLPKVYGLKGFQATNYFKPQITFVPPKQVTTYVSENGWTTTVYPSGYWVMSMIFKKNIPPTD